ncbi:cytochrome P450 [Streptomyces sp. NPDC097619]|uniref:cytochrome P450 n=1 Tax=Streptomyces sp. NPDC097619 TaxID=3157228 RepID=UPI003320B242
MGTAPQPPSLPRAPGRVPLLGHMIPLALDPLGFLAALPRRGDVVEIRLGPVRAVVVCDPALTHGVLTDDKTFDKGGELIERLREVIGDGLGLCPHDRHRRQRRLAQPAFHHERMPGYADRMAEHAADVTGAWRPGQDLDVYAEMTGLTTRVLLASMFSSALSGPAEHEALRRDVTTVVDSVYRRLLTPRPLLRLPTPANRRYRRANARLHTVVESLLARRRAGPAEDGDLLAALTTAGEGFSTAPEDGLSASEVVANAMMFLLAGVETTASALAWSLHLIAAHPEVERGLHAEVDAVLEGNRPPRYADLPHLDLTGRIVTEALRLYPPGWLLTRTVTADTLLGGHPIARGTTVVYSPYVLQRRADRFEDPDRFDPDRWLPDRPRTDRQAFIPFSSGSRKCIGDAFAVAETTLTVAAIASCWTLRPVPGPPVTPARSASLYPRNLRMRTEARRP